jgi:HAD superfamily hydrolase (TIGR01509 family)
VKVVIFDFDGLILDTETPDYLSWQEVFEDHGSHLPLDVWARCVGARAGTFDPIAFLEECIGESVDHEALTQRRRARFHELVAVEEVMAGVWDYVRGAEKKGIRLGVASSADRPWVEGHLKRLGLYDTFGVVRTASDVAMAKPSPDLYLAVLEEFALTGQEGVALEDSPHGVTAAKAAGLFCVAVPNTITAEYDLAHADLRTDSLAALPLGELMEQMGRA